MSKQIINEYRGETDRLHSTLSYALEEIAFQPNRLGSIMRESRETLNKGKVSLTCPNWDGLFGMVTCWNREA